MDPTDSESIHKDTLESAEKENPTQPPCKEVEVQRVIPPSGRCMLQCAWGCVR